GVSWVLLERAASESLCLRAKAGMLEHHTVQALSGPLAAPILQHAASNGVVEFRVNGRGRVFDYAALTGGRGHFVYPQHLLVRAWADRLLEQGGQLRFGSEAVAIDAQASGALVRARSARGTEIEVRCRAVALTAGAGTELIPEGIALHERTYPFRWLTTIIEASPLGERTVYAAHPNGFAAQLRRSPQLTRYYLQIPGREPLSAWGDERLRTELAVRLGNQRPLEGAVVERDLLDLRVRVREPLQSGPVYLAGDAAHLVTPAGGKGMNLAIQDALELSQGFVERFCHGQVERLARYSETRLPQIWRAQEFSHWMLTLHSGSLLVDPSELGPSEASFAHRLHCAQIERLFTDARFAHWFAYRYAGVQEDAPAHPHPTPALGDLT
ncbi:MAG TPA: FAD-dependent monooxygenase, partial [Polyangiaceae bacterium]|nr:FAD-dependent monooxygenase [Polyangiaceae bacterium]